MSYSLRFIVLLVVVVSLLSAICFALPVALANWIMALTYFLLPAAFVAGLIFSTGSRRAFFIGGTVVLAMTVEYRERDIAAHLFFEPVRWVDAQGGVRSDRFLDPRANNRYAQSRIDSQFYIEQSMVVLLTLLAATASVVMRTFVVPRQSNS
jgi:hypothetical protein